MTHQVPLQLGSIETGGSFGERLGVLVARPRLGWLWTHRLESVQDLREVGGVTRIVFFEYEY